VILLWESFLCAPRWAIDDDRFYPMAAERLQQMRNLFPSADCSVVLAIRNPASFLPALVGAVPDVSVDELFGNTDPAHLRWSDTIAAMRGACPDTPITVWCDEETPFLWPEILQSVTGHSDALELAHTYDWFASVMTEDGLAKMTQWLQANPPMTEDQRRRIISIFLDKFYRPDVEPDISVLGWNDDFVDVLSELYEQDVDLIREMPGVTLLTGDL
jgi:hypothetical protein